MVGAHGTEQTIENYVKQPGKMDEVAQPTLF